MTASSAFAPTLWDLFEDAAGRGPDRPALVVDGRTVTYDVLRGRVYSAARVFEDSFSAGHRVAVWLPNCLDWVVTYLAAHATRLSLVGLNHRYHDGEVRHLLERTGAAGIVCPPDSAGVLPLKSVSTTEPWLQSSAFGVLSADPVTAQEDERLVVFTSGSSGEPKAIRHSDANEVLGGVFLNLHYTPMSPDDRYLVTTPLAHRPAQARLQAALATGATTILSTNYRTADLVSLIEDHGVTTIGTVPTALQDLVAELLGRTLDSVRVVHVASDAIRPALFQAARRVLPRAQFVSSYASTETGYVAVATTQELVTRPASAGRVVPGVDVWILDPNKRPAADGQSGEIVVRAGAPGSYTVSAGYVDDISGEFVDSEGWFHTGDLGYVEDGYLIFTGRKKNIVVSGGMNISVAEVEEQLLKIPGVREVALVGVPDERLGEKLVGLMVSDGNPPDASSVLRDLKNQISSYKVPREVRWVDEIPRTVTGKIARHRLRDSWTYNEE